MALNKQVHIYSVDTTAFYTDEEKRISEPLSILYQKRYEIKKISQEERTEEQKRIYKLINKRISTIKENLRNEFKSSSVIRELNETHMVDKNIVSVFESDLTRTAQFETNEVTDDILIVRAFYYDVLESLIVDGFIYKNEKYKIFTASAGQIRTKKTVFIKESLWNKYEKTLTCGLTLDIINSRGGMNVNKYLAYLALTNSATDLWQDFDIDRCIVVDDFETTFKTMVDYIDEKTYKIDTLVEKDVTIPHMDGCGIHLPKVNRKPFMVRMPWVKGLLVPMQFNSFVRENLEDNPSCSKIKDIYGKEYDIFKDDIQIIFTKSQFKMHKFYNSWNEYKDNFKKYNCSAGVCNEEPDKIKNAKINYQMMQTLEDMTEDELITVCEKINLDIHNISRDRDTMLKVLGVHEYNTEKNSLQQALEIYPELLQDEHCRQTLRDIRKKIVKEGKSGRLPVDGKYTFLIPDLVAFCEWLFLGIENPKGILEDGEVSCKMYSDEKELDVLRAPHLYMEHAIRKNIINKDTKRWFISKGIYTSAHDPISRILQFDVDGDKSLVVQDETIINVAKRNIKKHNIVPLYYDMGKANPEKLSNSVLYKGMINAYSGGNIGAISNDITKIWNSDGDIKEKLTVIRYLCMENNFVIDYAKTLYKPTRPDDINELIRSYTKSKTPKFFMYAKDKNEHQVECINTSTVNKLENIVKNKPFKFNSEQLGKFDFKKLKKNKIRKIKDSDKDLIDAYVKLNRNKNRFDYNTNTYTYTYNKIRNELLNFNNDVYDLLDVLIEYLFPKKCSKLLLFECFGDEIVNNLNNNIDKKIGKNYIMCKECGKRVEKENNRTIYCKLCSEKIQQEQKNRWKRENWLVKEEK